MSSIRVFDVETTGIDPVEHRVIEIAAYDLHPDKRIELVGSSLVKPDRQIPPEASAVHHLIASDLAQAEPFASVWTKFLAGAPMYFAAHNCDFEQRYLPAPADTLWICTHKCALRVWAEAPGHGNQVLRYWSGLDGVPGFDRQIAGSAHRAAPDAYVTAWLLSRLLDVATVEQLIAWTNEPRVYPRLTFGKHRGQKWSEVPSDYLVWLRDGQHQMDEDWRYGARLELQGRK